MSSASQNYHLSDDLLGPVLAILDAHQDPYLMQGLVSAGCVTKLDIEGKRLQLGLCYPYPCQSQYRDTVMAITNKLAVLDAIDEVECEIDFQPAVISSGAVEPLPNVKQVIAVASGKGGVGKSTTSVNLALALAAEGAKVGILDADIYGPSIPLMLGVPNFNPVSPDGKMMTAAEAHGIAAQSIGFIVSGDEAAVWRGPMAAGALAQLLNETLWPELDYLVIDMPPGTGDIQLTLSQKVPVSGAVVVTTPQDIALADAKKGISMFQKVNIPVLGIVENMSFHICSDCGHKEHLFGEDGGLKMAERYNVPLLGQLPLQLNIREDVDKGVPTVVADGESQVALLYKEIARKVGAQLALSQTQSVVSISISDDE
ncbi:MULTISPECIES: iron-sulfur cluster carrier protein ApbC [Shewanella]|uniref:Iron-sulfur cluster carrier protein n=1 Tax=Shewanella marisflavi TaxID=260364 RepID=A0AAC9U2A6_9GAMM|nr:MULTISPECIES: iron-sulfur cluster carrier protein ApbC [Shewanella]ASJ97156.1 ATP-binding protein [Shewanella marisflavi]MCL1042283.1 iron-sulfur cluster carrier protein ApbC [Shewanella marisflavi]QDF75694.1 iron-sulfur cluster carrier protein ApbC [Shewanella marisflavi]